MNLYPVDPLANGHPPKLSAKPLDSGLLATLKVSWIIGATQLLAELACVAAALAVYLPSGVSTDAPFLLNYLHLWIYLGQGLYLVSKERSWAGEWSSHKKPWWRLGIAVLGWPMHLTLVTFHQKVNPFRTSQCANIHSRRGEHPRFATVSNTAKHAYGRTTALKILLFTYLKLNIPRMSRLPR